MENNSQADQNLKMKAYQWLITKMKEKFDRDFNLNQEVVFYLEENKVRAVLTPESSGIPQQELLTLSFLVNQINNDENSFE